MSEAVTGASGTDEYVRLRAGKDGGRFVVPAACLMEMSATMKGMLETSSFMESECLLDVPRASQSLLVAALNLRGGGGGTSDGGLADPSSPGGTTPLVIAVDGPAASGKGTLSRKLAERLGFAHLDTGSLYRATALRVLRAGLTPEESVEGSSPRAATEALSITPEDLSDPELRLERVGQAASLVSASPPVRQALLDFQHSFCRSPPGGAKGAVLDGRDIGTVVWPQAQTKFFVTANLDTRALRRWKELMDAGRKVILEDVKQQMVDRDERDSSRDAAPLKAADDAMTIDTSDLDPDQSFSAAWAAVSERMPEVATQQHACTSV